MLLKVSESNYVRDYVAKAYLKISYADGTSDGLIDVNALPTLDDEGWFDEFRKLYNQEHKAL